MGVPGRFRKFALNVALVLGGLFFVAVLLEAGLRVASPQHRSTGYRPDPYLLWRGVPGAKAPGGARRNSLGFYDTEHARKKPKGVKRVLVLGDSFMEGLGVPLEHTFSKRLDALLSRGGKRWEVINAGMGGWGPDQEYIYLLREGLSFEPDVVVMGFFLGNDVLDVGRKDLVRIVDREVKTGGPVTAGWVTRLKGFLQNHCHLYVFMKKRLIAWDFTRGLLSTLGLTGEAESVVDTVKVAAGERALPNQLIMILKDYPEGVLNAWSKTEGLLRGFKDLGEEKGFAFIVLAIPDRVQMYRGLLEKLLKKYSLDDKDIDTSHPNRLLGEILERNDIPHLDLTGSFLEEGVEETYHPEALHWNEKGHRTAARDAAHFIEQETGWRSGVR